MKEFCKKYFIIFILTPFYIIAIVLNFLSIFRDPYNFEEINNLKESWEKSPIISISFDENYFYNLGQKINKNNVKDLHKALIVKRLDKKYNYKYLLKEDVNDPDFHPCGKDGEDNFLFLPNGVECPINEFKISIYSDPERDKEGYNFNYYHYKTSKFYNGIYFHYSNENIYSTILTDIDFELVESRLNHYEPYRQILLRSNNIIENGYDLYFIMKNYIGFKLEPMIDGKRDLTDFKSFLKYGYKLYLNITSLILLILSLVTLIIDIIKEEETSIFQVITTISLYLQIVIQILIYRYFREKEHIYKIMNKYYDIYYLETEYFKYNTVVLSFVVIITTFYLFFTNHRTNDNNYYYYLVYCFRYSIFSKCCYCCKERSERNKKRNNEIINELNITVNELENKKYHCEIERRNLIEENENIMKEIVNKSNILNNMKNDKSSLLNINEEEENKFEEQFQQLIKDNELNVKKFKNIKNEIKNIEKEINYYKMIQFKQELNNQ